MSHTTFGRPCWMVWGAARAALAVRLHESPSSCRWHDRWGGSEVMGWMASTLPQHRSPTLSLRSMRCMCGLAVMRRYLPPRSVQGGLFSLGSASSTNFNRMEVLACLEVPLSRLSSTCPSMRMGFMELWHAVCRCLLPNVLPCAQGSAANFRCSAQSDELVSYCWVEFWSGS